MSVGTLIASRTHALMRRAFARLTCAFSDMADAHDGEAAPSGVPVSSASGTPKKPESAKRFAVLGSDEPSSHFVTACREMSETKTGALIVIGQQSDLRLIAEGGIALDAKVSTSLIKNIFFKNAPLHDGAAIIEGDRIVAAKCILPVTQSDVPKSYGTRHRAAIGMSEISDAIIVVVSEETGDISIAQGGEIRLNIDPVRLQQTLQRYLTINTRKRSKKEVAE